MYRARCPCEKSFNSLSSPDPTIRSRALAMHVGKCAQSQEMGWVGDEICRPIAEMVMGGMQERWGYPLGFEFLN